MAFSLTYKQSRMKNFIKPMRKDYLVKFHKIKKKYILMNNSVLICTIRNGQAVRNITHFIQIVFFLNFMERYQATLSHRFYIQLYQFI